MPPRLSNVKRALLYHTFQTSEQSPDTASAPSTNHKQQGGAPTVRQNTADDTDNDTSCQMPAPRQAKESSTQKTLWNVPSSNVVAVARKKSKNPQKTKTHKHLSSDSSGEPRRTAHIAISRSVVKSHRQARQAPKTFRQAPKAGRQAPTEGRQAEARTTEPHIADRMKQVSVSLVFVAQAADLKRLEREACLQLS